MKEDYAARIENAWRGRVAGCMLGKAVEVFSMRAGHGALRDYLQSVNALPLRDYVPYDESLADPLVFIPCCRGRMQHSEPDDDINYSVLALMLLEDHGAELTTTDVARAWLKYLPLASTYTAERAAYRILLTDGHEWFPEGHELGFDIARCADNPYNDWIGAQIRADVYGWVAPGNPALAARLARTDAELSHRGDGVYGAVAVAVMGAVLAGGGTIGDAIASCLEHLPGDSGAAAAIHLGLAQHDNADGGDHIREHYGDMSPVHTLNNLALVSWALARYADDFDAAIGEVVAAGLDTDCNGATVGALWALQGKPISAHWIDPWQNRIHTSLAGVAATTTEVLTQRTMRVAQRLEEATI